MHMLGKLASGTAHAYLITLILWKGIDLWPVLTLTGKTHCNLTPY